MALSRSSAPTIMPAAMPPFAAAERPVGDDDDGSGGGDEVGLAVAVLIADDEAPLQKNVPSNLDSLNSFCRDEQSSGFEVCTNTSPSIRERAGKSGTLL